MSDRYYKSQEDVQNEAYVRRLNAETEAQKQAMNQAAYEQQNSFIDPAGRVSPSSEAPGFGQSFGTGAGGNAYIMGMDYGINAGAPDVSGRQQYPGMQPIEAPQFEPEKNIENVDLLTNKYYENTGLLNEISKTAARAGFNIKDPDPMNADERNMANYYNELLNKTKLLGNKLNEGYRIREEMAKNPEKFRATAQGAGINRTTNYQDVLTTKIHPVIEEFNKKTEPVYYDYNAWQAKTKEAKALKEKFKAYADATDNYQQKAKYLEDMNAIVLPEYDGNKAADRGLEQQKINDARNKPTGRRYSAGVTDSDIANLEELIFRMRNHGDVGILAQDIPGANVVEEAGQRYFTGTTVAGQPFKVNLDNKEAVASIIIGNNPKFTKLTLADIQEYEINNGKWAPSEEINFRVNKSDEAITSLIKGFDEGDVDIETLVSELTPVLKAARVKVGTETHGVSSVEVHGAGFDDIRLILDDGSEVDYDLNGYIYDNESDFKKLINSIPINALIDSTKGITGSDRADKKGKNLIYRSDTGMSSGSASNTKSPVVVNPDGKDWE